MSDMTSKTDKRAASLSKAFQTNNLEKISKYKELCRNGTLLCKSLDPQDQVKMPAIALVLETKCSNIKPET